MAIESEAPEPPAAKPEEAAAATPEKKKKKKKKNGCGIDGCKERVVLLIGDCKWCSKSFCQKHRLPESHACPEIKGCKAAASEILAQKVGGMKCVAQKMGAI